MPGETDLGRVLRRFDPLSLEELDERAALLRRVDRKYALGWDGFLELIERLRADHQVLAIDGRTDFAYRSVYFDTPERRCFVDHVEDRTPRFKTRTRLYKDTGTCVFEVKLKRSDGEMDKRQVEHPADRHAELTTRDLRCAEEALSGAGLERPDRLDATLTTSFTRITLAARERSARLTCDLAVTITRPGGASAQIRDGLVVIETKSEDGESPGDLALAQVGADQVSLSKYRAGMALVGDAPVNEPQPGTELFVTAGA